MTHCRDDGQCRDNDAMVIPAVGSYLAIFNFPGSEREASSHLEGTFLIDFPVNLSLGFLLLEKLHCPSYDCQTVIERRLRLDSANLL